MGRGKRNGTVSVTPHLSSDPRARQVLPPSAQLITSPRRQRMLETSKLIRELDPYFTSTRRQAEACGQREDTFLPWRNATKAPAQDEAIERIRHLLAFLPRLAEVAGSEKEAGLWLVTYHYDLPLGQSGDVRFGYRKPAQALHLGRDEAVLRAAKDDFSGAKRHRAAVLSLGHKLVAGEAIVLWDSMHKRHEQPSQAYAPYFHHHPKAGETLYEKLYGSA